MSIKKHLTKLKKKKSWLSFQVIVFEKLWLKFTPSNWPLMLWIFGNEAIYKVITPRGKKKKRKTSALFRECKKLWLLLRVYLVLQTVSDRSNPPLSPLGNITPRRLGLLPLLSPRLGKARESGWWWEKRSCFIKKSCFIIKLYIYIYIYNNIYMYIKKKKTTVRAEKE